MWFKSIVSLLFSSFIVVGLQAQNPRPATIKIDPTEAEVVEFTDLAKDITVLKLEDTRESILGHVDNLLITESRIYVLTGMPNSFVVAFDRNGKYLFKVRATGQGPEEVDRVTNIAVDGEDLMVYGDLSRKVLRINKDGEFQRAYKLDLFAYDFVKTDTGWLFYLQSFSSGENGDTRLALTDENFQDPIYMFKPKKTGLGFGFYYREFARGDQGVSFVMAQNDTLFNFKDGGVSVSSVVDFGSYGLDESEKERPYSRQMLERLSKITYARLGKPFYQLPDYTSFIYVYGNRQSDPKKGTRQVYVSPKGVIRWHYYQLALSEYNATLPYNAFTYQGQMVTAANCLELFNYNRGELDKDSRKGLSEGYGIMSLEAAMQVMKTDDNPYLFFYKIR